MSEAESSQYSSRAMSPRVLSPRALTPAKQKQNRFNKLAPAFAWGAAAFGNPFVRNLLTSALMTGVATYGVDKFRKANNKRVETVKAYPVYGVPKEKAPTEYYNQDYAFPNPINRSVPAKCFKDPKYCPTPTPEPTPTPSITNPMNNTSINVVNKNA